MRSTTIIVHVLILCALLTGCTIQKRLYNKGLHVEWKKKNHLSKGDEVAKKWDPETVLFTPQEFSTADSTINIVPTESFVSNSSIDPEITPNHSKESSFKISHSSIQAKVKSIKRFDDDEKVWKPVNKVLLILAMIFGVIFLTLLILIIVLNPVGSPLAAALGTGFLGIMSMILFSQAFKKKEAITDEEIREPINKRRLLFAIIFGVIFLTLMTLIIALDPITLPFLILPTGAIGVVSMILFAKTFKKKKKPKLQTIKIENPEEQKKKSMLTFERLRNAALIVTFLALFAILLTVNFVIASYTTPIAALGALFFGLIALILLFASLFIWDSASDAKKAMLNGESEKVETESDEPKKNRAWVLLIFIAIGAVIVLFGKYS